MKEQIKTNESMFNAGFLKLCRIDSIRKMIHDARRTCKFWEWREALVCLRDELNERMNKEQRKIADRYESQMNEVLSKMVRPETIKYEHIQVFSNFGRFLFDREHEQGLAMPNKPSDLEATEV